MARALVIGLATLLATAVVGCDGEDGTTTTTPDLAELEPCGGDKGRLRTAGRKVAGDITCDELRAFVTDTFFPSGVDPAGERHPPGPKRGEATVGAYDCHWRVFASQPGWDHVTCANGSARFKFDLTP